MYSTLIDNGMYLISIFNSGGLFRLIPRVCKKNNVANTLSINVKGEKLEVMVPRNTPIPTSQSKTFAKYSLQFSPCVAF